MRGTVAKQLRMRAKESAQPGQIEVVYQKYKLGFKKIKQAQSSPPKLKETRRQKRLSHVSTKTV